MKPFHQQQLTHWGRVTHICVSKQSHHRSRKWLVAWSAPIHYLNRWWNIVNLTLRNKVQWNRKQNSCISIQENVFENVVWKMTAILSRPQCVKIWLYRIMKTRLQTMPLWQHGIITGDTLWMILCDAEFHGLYHQLTSIEIYMLCLAGTNKGGLYSVIDFLRQTPGETILTKYGVSIGRIPITLSSSPLSSSSSPLSAFLVKDYDLTAELSLSLLCPRFKEVEREVILVPTCASVRLWTESCPLFMFNNSHRIPLLFAHFIKQLQKVCRVLSAFQN